MEGRERRVERTGDGKVVRRRVMDGVENKKTLVHDVKTRGGQDASRSWRGLAVDRSRAIWMAVGSWMPMMLAVVVVMVSSSNGGGGGRRLHVLLQRPEVGKIQPAKGSFNWPAGFSDRHRLEIQMQGLGESLTDLWGWWQVKPSPALQARGG